MKVISIIPARGGSKGITKKNIVDLAGKPLISYTIESSLNSKIIERTFVSTEDKEISDIAKRYDEIVLVKRPLELAEDHVSNIDVIFHVLDLFRHEIDKSTIVVLLQPTSPLRSSEDIDGAIMEFKKGNCDSVIGVSEVSHPPQWSLKIKDGYIDYFFKRDYLLEIRQDLEKAYIPNGTIFIATVETLKKNRTYYCEKIRPFIIPFERSIDIDRLFDLKLAEFLLQNKK